MNLPSPALRLCSGHPERQSRGGGRGMTPAACPTRAYNRHTTMHRVLAALLVCCGAATGAAAQSLPSEPATFANGRVVVGGDVSVAFAPQDLGFFNYSDYEHST